MAYRFGPFLDRPSPRFPKVAYDFAGEQAHGAVLFIIRAVQYVDMAQLSRYPTEDEFLLPPHCRFRVTKVVRPSLHPDVLEVRDGARGRGLGAVCYLPPPRDLL